MFRNIAATVMITTIELSMLSAAIAQTPTLVPTPAPSALPQPTNPVMPPTAKKIPKTFENFGDKRVDDYAWLREKENPAVVDYLKAENAHLSSVMGHLKEFQETLYKDMLSRIKETDDNVPYFKRGYWYNSRTEMGKEYQIYTRRKGTLEAKEEITLDGNELAKGQKFMSIGSMAVSPNGKLLAYSVDFTGFRQYTLHIKNLETGEVLADKIERVTSLAWANDNQTIFYVTEDATTKRSDKFFRHRLSVKEDAMLYEEKDELYGIGVDITRDIALIILNSESSDTNEQRLLDASSPDGNFTVYQKRKDNVKYFVDHHEKSLLTMTNDTGRNYRLVKAPVSATANKKNWQEIIAHRKDVKLDGVDIFKDFFVAIEKKSGLPQ
ncbi:MAG: oligopeptidase B, partial [Pseudomonadota bacterium]